MCIYYNNESGLTYKSQEHIFPATVGGIYKLPEEYVSDKANAYFSKLESELVTSSTWGLYKMLYGIGDRGKNKPGRMPINLIKSENSEELGFSFKGKPIPIPQLVLYANKTKIRVARDLKYQTDNDLIKLKNKILDFNENTRYNLLDVKFEESNFIFAYYNNSIYIAVDNIGHLSEYIEIVRKCAINKLDLSTKKILDISKTEHPINLKINKSTFAKIYAKTAFNILAKIKGVEYVNDNKFDDFRNKIIGKNKIEFNPFYEKFGIQRFFNIGEHSYYCLMMNNRNKYFSVAVSFFNNLTLGFDICEKFDSYFNTPFLYICDWENNQEYCLEDKLLELIKK